MAGETEVVIRLPEGIACVVQEAPRCQDRAHRPVGIDDTIAAVTSRTGLSRSETGQPVA